MIINNIKDEHGSVLNKCPPVHMGPDPKANEPDFPTSALT